MRIALPTHIDPSAPGHCTGIIGRLSGETMGTNWSVRLVHPPDTDLTTVQQAIQTRLNGLVAEMSHWQDDSLLSRFNQLPAGEWLDLPADFAHVMTHGLDIARQSDSAFDPAIGHLVSLWGFGPHAASLPPDHMALARARTASGHQRLILDGHRLQQPGGLALDLSGIAKGHAVDAISRLLRDLGYANSLVEIGGELVGRGLRPDLQPWWVDLENPPGTIIPLLRIALHDLAVATSGNYRRGDHSIDPRNGQPCQNALLSVSVIANTALDADAWATALTVLGTEQGADFAKQNQIAARFLHRSSSGMREVLTPALKAMLAD